MFLYVQPYVIRILLIYGLFLVISNYWTRLSKISWFVSGKQINYYSASQIIYLRDTDKSWYFAITKFNKCLIIWSPGLFFKEYLREAKWSAISSKSDRKKEKSVVSFMHKQNSICSQNSWMTLRMSKPSFVGSYLQVMWWALGQWTGRNICIKW